MKGCMYCVRKGGREKEEKGDGIEMGRRRKRNGSGMMKGREGEREGQG